MNKQQITGVALNPFLKTYKGIMAVSKYIFCLTKRVFRNFKGMIPQTSDPQTVVITSRE